MAILPLSDFAAAFDRASLQPKAQEAERLRARLRELFPGESLGELPLEKYGYPSGLGKGTLCYEYEYGSDDIGSISGMATKFGVFFNNKSGGWKSRVKGEPDAQKAWPVVRSGLVHALALAGQGRWENIDAEAPLTQALRTKMTHVFFPEEVLPIFSLTHLKHYLGALGIEWRPGDGRTAAANRRLLLALRDIPALHGWNPSELGFLLYEWNPPTKASAGLTFEEFLSDFDRSQIAAAVAAGEEQRRRIVDLYPRESLSTLSMERYAAGEDVPEENLAQLLGRGTPALGDVASVGSNWVRIYRLKGSDEYKSTLENAGEAAADWPRLRDALMDCCELAGRNEWVAIDKVKVSNWIPPLRTKLLHVYFPHEVLPVYAKDELGRLLDALGIDFKPGDGKWAAAPNRRLLEHLRGMPELDGWSTMEMALALRAWMAGKNSGTPRVLVVSPGPDGKYKDDCFRLGLIFTGWGQTGDLSGVSDETDVEEAFEAAQMSAADVEAADKEPEGRTTHQTWLFVSAKPGDVIVANEKRRDILAIGTVVDPGYEYRQPPIAGLSGERHCLSVKWDLSLARKSPVSLGRARYAVKELTGNERRAILNLLPPSENEEIPTIIQSMPPMPAVSLNRIVYGPPGTGKTYRVIREAACVLNGGPLDDAAAKLRYDEAVQQGRIRLATFHQSFTYEDFVEGIRPVMDESGAAKFEVRDGVFKDIAVEAMFACLERVPQSSPAAEFDDYWDAFFNQVSEAEELEIPGLKHVSWVLSPTSKGNLRALNKVPGTEFRCSRAALAKVWQAMHPKPKITFGESQAAYGKEAAHHVIAAVYNYMHTLPPRHGVRDGEKVKAPANASEIVSSYLELGAGSGWQLRADGKYPPYVLVIDEINRGNISRIFGELITLIEDDKRHGAPNALCVTLPASREVFTVPPNLYLLGTMNTADKSLALLDVALRRRFDFEELGPDFSITGMPGELQDVLEEINERLERRKDRDHRIGHAFFMGVTDAAGFNRAFRRKVVPLLQEYFFNDVDGARYVLGEEGRTDDDGFLRRLDGQSKFQRNRWRWFTDEEPDMNCCACLMENFKSVVS